MWGQVIVVEHTDPEHSRVNADAEKEDGKEASNLKNKQNQLKKNGPEHFAYVREHHPLFPANIYWRSKI